MNSLRSVSFLALIGISLTLAAAEPQSIKIWPGGRAPGDTAQLPEEKDMTKPEDKLIAGRRIIKLGNVSEPAIAVYPAPKSKANGASVVICPGGGHNILAYDLEGTEVAEWLNSIGVTAFVLKYRVPSRDKENRGFGAAQDGQRAVSLVRSRAQEWKIDPKRIGILGFSAGGETAALTSIFTERRYAALDEVDKISHRPDYAILIYPGGLLEKDNSQLKAHVKVTSETPPMFFAHAQDDRVSPLNCTLLFNELKKANVPAELHIYSHGGHGYGLRVTEDPVTTWSRRCEEWMRRMGYLDKTR